MQNNHVSCHYLVTTTPTFCTALVDLSRSRSVHAVEHNPCCPDPTILSASECKAVHYGLCSPLLKLPSFTIPPVTTSNPNSPTTPKGTSPNLNISPKGSDSPKLQPTSGQNSPRIAAASVNSFPQASPVSPATPKSTPSTYHPLAAATTVSGHSSPCSNAVTPPPPISKVDLEIFDPVELLAADLEGKLEALVNTFVAQDKVRLAARKKSDPSSPVGTLKKATPVAKTKGISSTLNDNVDYAENGLSRRTNETSQVNQPPTKKTSEDENPIKTPKGQMKTISEPHKTKEEADGDSKFHVKPQIGKGDPIVNLLDSMNSLKEGKFPLDNQQTKLTSLTSLAPLKPSPEYQQTGVKAQISMFATREKERSQSPVNSLERRQTKNKSQLNNEPMSPSFKPGPLSLDELQELLKSTSEPLTEPIQTTIFQSTKIPALPFEGTSTTKPMDSLSFSPQKGSVPSAENYLLSSPQPLKVQTLQQKPICEPSYPSMVYQNESVLKQQNPSQAQVFGTVHQESSNRMNQSQEFLQSPVDYAKARFQNVQQFNKHDDSKPKPKNGHLVTEAKYKWEHLPENQWSSLPETVVTNGDPLSHKRALSMEGLLDVPSPSIPHPKLTNVQKQHIKERSLSPTDRHSHVPIRPFLTKGSVAERVLLFECCPDRALERASSGSKNKPLLINTWRSGGSDVHNKTQGHHHQSITKDKENIEPASPRSSSLKRFAYSSCKSPSSSKRIPRFYYPDGKPSTPAEIEGHLQRVAAVFSGLTEGKASREEFGIITKACGLPLYWKLPLFLAARGDKRASVSCDTFLEFWRRVVNTCHDEASKFIYVLTRGSRNYLVQQDFVPLMEDVIDSHPGLTFLKEATAFHSRYIHTVIARIYYGVNRSWSGKITVPELRRSNFLRVLATLEEEEDINQITEYFSYEHFYVIYCKFWELDKDHDLFIDQNDLRHHNGGALSMKIIQRIFSGAVTRGPSKKEGKMSYTDFVWFLISEEDKRHPRSIEYWFRCMDLDGDGYLSMYELEYFYQEQLQRLDALGVEPLPFNDCLCQMLDIIKPKVPGKISLSDLKKCKMTPIFFDTFFNLEKYLDHEHRDPFASQREHDVDGPEISDWDRYAADEYELLVVGEAAAEQQDELYGNFDEQEDALSPNLDKLTAESVNHHSQCKSEDEEYDYAETDIDCKC